MNIEIRDIAVSTLIISLAFAWSSIIAGIRGDFMVALYGFLVALLAVGSGFILHELAHRTVARKFGSHAEYRAWRFGLIMAILTAVISMGSIVFAAPGAVHIKPKHHARWYKLDHRAEIEETGIISIAGPATNILLAAVFLLLFNITGFAFLTTAAMINAWLALFNSIPIPPLDGSKIMAWDVKAWVLLIVVSIVALVLSI